MISRAVVEAALARRARRAGFSPAFLCHAKQLAFIGSPARRRTARTSRRAGKTVGEAIALLAGALEPPHLPQLYVTLTRANSKEILWPDLLRLNHEHALGGEPNLTDLSLRWPSGAAIMLRGANNEREIAKIRGHKFKRAIIDEGQSFPDRVIRPLVHDIIEPTLLDVGGDLLMSGTPGPAPVGFFWDATDGAQAERWEQHRWTIRDNPYLPALARQTIEDILDDVRRDHGWTEDDPTYRREYLGEWARDENALVFRWSTSCEWDGVLPAGEWQYVVGVDLGHDDADAIAVLAWSRSDPAVRLVHEDIRAHQGITELGEKLVELHGRYRPRALWVDTGGLGKKVAEELRRRWSLPVQAAEKQRKLEHIELLNDALRTGRFRASAFSRFAEDAQLVQWDLDARARGLRVVSGAFHSDVCDAVLYAYRACRAYLYEAPAEAGDPQLAERSARVAARIERQESSRRGIGALLR